MNRAEIKGCRWFGLQKKAGHATKLCPDMSTCDEINCTNPELQPYTDHSDLGARNTDDHIQEKLIQKWKEGKLDENSPLYKLIAR